MAAPMKKEQSVKDDAENILYDLLVLAEWPQEPETSTKVIAEKPKGSLIGKLSSAAYRSTWTFLRSTGLPLRSSTPCSLPATLIKLVNAQINWHMTTTSNDRLLAILEDSCLEIRSARDDYTASLGKCSIPKDPYPQWRQLAWSPDCTMLACSDSSGNVLIVDLMGIILFTIDKTSSKQQLPGIPSDLSCAVASLMFTEHKKTTKWSAELIVITYHGSLHSYLVSSTDGYILNHSFQFSSEHPLGLSSALFLPTRSLLLIGSCSQEEGQDAVTMAARHGISAWRRLDEEPYYKLVTDYSDEINKPRSSRRLLRKMTSISIFNRADKDGIYKMCLSPDGQQFVSVQQSGMVALWDIPSLKNRGSWSPEIQPGYDEKNPNILIPSRKKPTEGQPSPNSLIDINFWSKEALILARYSGAVAVASTGHLTNLLGDSSEWFEPAPKVNRASNKGFLSIECESKTSALKRRRMPSDRDHDDSKNQSPQDDDDDSDEDEDTTMLMRTTKLMKQAMYFVTESERFQPPRKRPKVVSRTYRLVSLQKTTPEELYARRIENEEYGEALVLARRFNLDADLVYQRQWRKARVSIAAIQDYLSKITKRAWVLHECMERVPDDIDAARELLQYGLRGTDLEALVAIQDGEDHGRFILSSDVDVDDSMEHLNDSHQTDETPANKEKREGLLQQVNFKSLTLEQRELCRCRLKLLTYLERLGTYEVILGGGEAAARFYSDHFFKTFRSQNIVEATMHFARDSDWQAVETLFTHHGNDLLPHWLMILNNFPETTNPAEYNSLLPEVSLDTNAEGEVLEWEVAERRSEDWCEGKQCQAAINPTPMDYGAFLYEEQPELAHFRAGKLNTALLTVWYVWRAMLIERQSSQVDNALELINLGMERNIEGLNMLHNDLLTLEVMTYECQTGASITLDDLQSMADLDKIHLMMSKSPKDMYVKNIKRWVIPFLERWEKLVSGKKKELLTQYMLSMAKEDLTNCVMIFETSKPTLISGVIKGDDYLMSLALQCVYTSDQSDQLSQALAILDCMPRRSFGMQTEEISALHNQLCHLSDHLRAAEILIKNEVPKPPRFIRDSERDEEQAKGLMIRLARQAARRKPPLNVGEWKQLLRDMLELQRKVYTCLEPQLCYEIHTESLLGSSSLPNIQLAGEMLTRSSSTQDHASVSSNHGNIASSTSSRISYEKSVELVLSAAREYFNSSTDLMDSCMDLARSCLQLLHDCPPGVQEELDLIASLALLDDYNVSILPLQVRLCAKRLELVQKALSSMPSSYKDAKLLVRLAKLLRVSGTSEADRKGQVLLLVAEAALAAADYRAMHHTCIELIQSGYSPGWSVCYKLAMVDEFRDLSAKRELLAFSLAHCEERSLEVILKARNALELQILCLSVNSHSSHASPSISVDQDEEETVAMETETETEPLQHEEQTVLRSAIGKTTAKTRQVLAATGTTTKAVLAAVGDRRWWKDTLKWVRPLAGDSRSTAEEYGVRGHGNIEMEYHGCHPFYRMVIDNHFVGRDQMNYGLYRVTQNDGTPVKLSQDILHAGLMEGTSEPNLDAQNKVLLRTALEIMTFDLTLGLCYLLALPNPLEAEHCFEQLPRTAMSLQLAAYYYALQIHHSANPSQVTTLDPAYQLPPNKLIGRVVGQVTGDSGCDWSEVQKGLVSQLQRYMELLADFTQAEALQALGRGVDVARFTQDSDYKHETILGLAMTTEQEVYQLSISLAQRYQLPLWEVYMTHLEFLFSDSGFTTPNLEDYTTTLKILPTLASQPSDFYHRLNLYVLPTIQGSDHNRLIYYYTLLQNCGSKVKGDSVTPEVHIKSLKKLKAAAPGLDYKSLLDGETDPVDVIGPVLSGSNVHVIAKLASKIPLQGGGNVSSSQVFLAYIIKLFWEGDQGNKKTPESTADWLHRYEACGEFMSRLSPADFTAFIASVIFNEQSIQKLELECRQNIVNRALKFSRQQSGKQKLAASTGSFTLESALVKLQQYGRHLQSLESEGVQELIEYDKAMSSTHTVKYDLTQGDADKLKAFFVTLLTSGVTLELASGLLKLTTLDRATTLSVVQHTLETLLTLLKGERSEVTKGLELNGEPLEMTGVVLGTISKHEQLGGNMVSTGQVLDVLRPFCSDSSINAKLRIDVLLILEKTFELGEEDALLLLFYRTEALVSSLWKQEVLEADVVTNKSRHDLFTSLLKNSHSMEQLITLSRLLQQWPSLQTTESGNDPSHSPWVELLVAWIQHPDNMHHNATLLDVFEYFEDNNTITSECVEVLYQELVGQGSMLTAMKLILITKDTRLFPFLLDYMHHEEQISPSCYDNKLFHLLVNNELTAQIVTTPYYAPLIDYLLTSTDADQLKSKVKVIVGQLRLAGHEAAAGTLLLQCQGVHPMLGTLDTAFSALRHWLGK